MADAQADRGKSPSKRRRGRPVQMATADRREAILDAAERLLAREGIAGATMTGLARECGMSTRTLYEVIGSREDLLTAYMRRLRDAFIHPLSDRERAMPLPERLRCLLWPEDRVYASDLPVTFLRMVIAEAPNRPALAAAFQKELIRAPLEVVQAELDHAVACGEILLADTRLGAQILIDMAFSNALHALTAPEEIRDAPSEDRPRLTFAIKLFLSGCACKPAR